MGGSANTLRTHGEDSEVVTNIVQLSKMSQGKLLKKRYKKFRRMGEGSGHSQEAMNREVNLLMSITSGDAPPDLQIAEVVVGAPAALAGLLAGDELLDLDGTPLDEFEQLAVLLDSYAVGDEVTFNVDRGGDVITVAVELGAWPG